MAAPSIRPNFLATEEDRRVMIEGMKIVRHIVEQAPMDPFRQMELAPGADCRSDDDWLEFARKDGQTIYHICGTCRMGTDDKAVTDPTAPRSRSSRSSHCRCFGYADIVSGNTQAAVFMIAEKAADLILGNRTS